MTITLSKPAILLIATLAALAAVLFFFGVIQGGDLEPPNGPDMGTTQIPPTWHQKLPADDGPPCNSSRFRCVFPTAAFPAGEAALDNTTGLVWQRSPAVEVIRPWHFLVRCYSNKTGGVQGWRPAHIEELHSLVDLDAPADPLLPVGHPFLGVTSDTDFWAITMTLNSDLQALINPFNGEVIQHPRANAKGYIWCVRGEKGYAGGRPQ